MEREGSRVFLNACVSGAQRDVYRCPDIDSFQGPLHIKYHFLNVDEDRGGQKDSLPLLPWRDAVLAAALESE